MSKNVNAAPTARLDVITVGRVSVDLYAQQVGASFLEPQTFMKSVGGSPTNVAVAAARYGLKAAVITAVGDDDLGRYVISQLSRWNVDTGFIGSTPGTQTPVVLAALDPPEDPKITFYRHNAPDTSIIATPDMDSAVSNARVFWISAGALTRGSTADAVQLWAKHRARLKHTIIDLDYRPTLWESKFAAREKVRQALDYCTVAIGNRAECDMAVGESDPDKAADMLLALGIQLAVVKMGGGGVLLATESDRVRIDPVSVDLVCGLGAGDAFGGALVLGLFSQWSLSEIGQFANAAGAYVVGQLSCADAMPTQPQVRQIMQVNSRGLTESTT
jgi:5-dehydro-2-deoxygluconokinase